jgi:hypothetical protein
MPGCPLCSSLYTHSLILDNDFSAATISFTSQDRKAKPVCRGLTCRGSSLLSLTVIRPDSFLGTPLAGGGPPRLDDGTRPNGGPRRVPACHGQGKIDAVLQSTARARAKSLSGRRGSGRRPGDSPRRFRRWDRRPIRGGPALSVRLDSECTHPQG